MKAYAGVGSRHTPKEILALMKIIAILLTHDGHVCATGACRGADQAFAEGALLAGGPVHLHIPWNSYEQAWRMSIKGHIRTFVLNDNDVEAYNSVSMFHPAFEKLSPSVKALHARNYNIVKNSSFIVCWTNGGQPIGGTGQAIRIATYLHLPVYNLGNKNTLDSMLAAVQRRSHELDNYHLENSGIIS